MSALLFNLRGQAGSDFTFTALDEATIIADIVALMNHVAPPRPVYVGHSIGGLFAARAQADPPQGALLGHVGDEIAQGFGARGGGQGQGQGQGQGSEGSASPRPR